MKNLEAISKEQASETSKEIFDSLDKKMGTVPNVYRAIGNSGPALKATLGIGEALGKGEFSGKETEAIALAVGQANVCGYCLAAHTAVGKMQGFSEDETVALRNGQIEDKKLKALTDLAKSITENRGYPKQDLMDNFFEVGYSKAALAELIVLVGLNTITNYTNHIAQTEVDFPAAPELAEA
ncbi:carboxymuconolactone decarboxylase family protein [Fulvivirga sp. RKSG066]|uniref:carboxymuconolactone decarboxylase family protein n=1 Tax=Fulvivirga aurantia TaxID=2529383 RepID=UPI0012BBD8EB|nr:carboxymuconolactone decarboxylase family protein [Fulvivirga aurantia]MTI22652.1 carboxymuconolactone decarboxylase family protein [Fulvivirga aurantia]